MFEDQSEEYVCGSWLAPSKGIQDSLGFWIPRGGFRIPFNGFQIFVKGTWILNSSR